MSKTNAFETAVLDNWFRNQNIANVGDATGIRGSSADGSLYVSLHTSDPGETGTLINPDGSTAGGGGAYDDEPTPRPHRPPRYVVRNGDDVLIYSSRERAEAAQRAIDEAARIVQEAAERAAQSGKRAAKRIRANGRAKAAQVADEALQGLPPLESFVLPEAQAWAQQAGPLAPITQALGSDDLIVAAALMQEMRDEDDALALLLMAD